jgi:hypothetical protein
MTNHKTLQDDQHYETDEHGLTRWQLIGVDERWETLGPDGKPVITSEGTRDDAIDHHLRSNGAFANHVQYMTRHGDGAEYLGDQLNGVT